MQSSGLKIFLLAFVVFANAQENSSDFQQLPDYIAPCYRDDPMLSECVKATMYGVVRKLADGVPELGVPPIEPLYKDQIDAFNVEGLSLKIKDIYIRGASKIAYTWVRASTKTKLYEFEGFMDQFDVDATYELSGYFFFVPIHAIGKIHTINRLLEFRVDAIVDVLKKNGVDFAKVNNVHLKTYLNDGSLWISNLGPLEAAINSLLNTRFNMRFILNHLTPIVEETITGIIQKFSNRLLNNVPYDLLLPKGTGPVPAYTVKPPDHFDSSLRFYNKKEFLDKVMSILE